MKKICGVARAIGVGEKVGSSSIAYHHLICVRLGFGETLIIGLGHLLGL
ncbi:MAG: hypothetical protein ACJZ64_05060 [Opitutales bacterium]